MNRGRLGRRWGRHVASGGSADSASMIQLDTSSGGVLSRALTWAWRLRHPAVASEHLLLALLEDAGVRDVLARSGVTWVDVEDALRSRLSRDGRLGFEDHLPWTRDAREAVHMARQEALGLGHAETEAGHLLLGVAAQDDGVAAEVLDRLGLRLEGLRVEILEQVAERDLRWDDELGAA